MKNISLSYGGRFSRKSLGGNMQEYKPNPEEMERRRKELIRILQEENENPQPRNRAERRKYGRRNKNTRRKF